MREPLRVETGKDIKCLECERHIPMRYRICLQCETALY